MWSLGSHQCMLGCWKHYAMIAWLPYRNSLDNPGSLKILHFHLRDQKINVNKQYRSYYLISISSYISSAHATGDKLRQIKHRFVLLATLTLFPNRRLLGHFRSSKRCVSGLVASRLPHLLAVSNVDMFMVISRALRWSPRTLHASFHTAWDCFTEPISVLGWPSANRIPVYWGVLWLSVIYWISHSCLLGIIITSTKKEHPQKANIYVSM